MYVVQVVPKILGASVPHSFQNRDPIQTKIYYFSPDTEYLYP